MSSFVDENPPGPVQMMFNGAAPPSIVRSTAPLGSPEQSAGAIENEASIGAGPSSVMSAWEVQPLASETTTVYVPTPRPLMCSASDPNPPGPFQLVVYCPVPPAMTRSIVPSLPLQPMAYPPPTSPMAVCTSNGVGWIRVMLSLALQPFPSVTTRMYAPADVPLRLASAEVKPPGPVQAYVYPGTPPFAPAPMLPLLPPLQLILKPPFQVVAVIWIPIGGGSLNTIPFVVPQPFASMIVSP